MAKPNRQDIDYARDVIDQRIQDEQEMKACDLCWLEKTPSRSLHIAAHKQASAAALEREPEPEPHTNWPGTYSLDARRQKLWRRDKGAR
jgi:hypothetical protein